MRRFDALIVGGGSAGSVLAARLSEDGRRSVLLLEAGLDWRGAEAPSEIRDLNFFHVFLRPEFFWTELRGRLTDAKEPEQYYVGRGLGGGSTVNAMFYVRPPPADFDRWAERGCRGWSGTEVLPHFRRAEADLDFGDRPYHGRTGPIPVWRPKRDDWRPLDRALHTSAADWGHPESPDLDFNAPEASGITAVPYSARDHARVSTNDAYLEPARARENLTVIGEATVDRVRWHGRTAVGVRAIIRGQVEEFEASRVVLSAGAIFTPAILLRSGVGPGPAVRRLGGELVSERPGLGRLQDHPLLSITFRLRERWRAPSPAPRGFFSSILVLWTSEHPSGRPNDLNVHSQSFIGTAEGSREVGGLVLGLGAVYSEGRVEVASPDPTRTPFVHVGMLSDRRDLVRLRQGVRHLFDLVGRPGLADAIEGEARLAPRGAEGRPVRSFTSDDDLEEALRQQCAQYFHPVGTCRMGALEDPLAVVDPDLRVIGTDGLYLCDASIMPEIVRCNTNATVVMIAEKAAEALRG